ncbi:MAG TPA: hypothetical protein VLG09_02640 [Candidatus Saccharimonadales bacterium]|nr:hypothetical protein [Candidatus Saccharimonadales bacterium]
MKLSKKRKEGLEHARQFFDSYLEKKNGVGNPAYHRPGSFSKHSRNRKKKK